MSYIKSYIPIVFPLRLSQLLQTYFSYPKVHWMALLTLKLKTTKLTFSCNYCHIYHLFFNSNAVNISTTFKTLSATTVTKKHNNKKEPQHNDFSN